MISPQVEVVGVAAEWPNKPIEIVWIGKSRKLYALNAKVPSQRLCSSQCLRAGLPNGRRKNNCRRTDVEHVFNVLGTMESCPTYFCARPKWNRIDLCVAEVVRIQALPRQPRHPNSHEFGYCPE